MATLTCQWCNKEYEGRKDSRYCKENHYKNCDNPECDNLFLIKEMKRPAKTCSKACADVMTALNKPQIKKVCEICKEDFFAAKSSEKFCNKKHIEHCIICNNKFELVSKGVRAAKTCSKKCAAALIDFEKRNKKSEKTLMSKYGYKNASQIPEVKEKKKKTTFKNHGVENIFLRSDIQKIAILNNGKTISKLNLKWQKNVLKETGIEFNLEVRIGDTRSHVDLGYENLLIDINPSETHNSTYSFPHFTGRCKAEDCEKTNHLPKNFEYHQKRALIAEENNKILLQYFDWYDPEIFISIIRSKLSMSDNVIYARKTELREIKQPEANRFLRENHLMGASTGQTLCLGLFEKDNNQLIHVQTYGKSRLNKNYEWEAIRSCTKLNYHVPGGFTKCDKYFFNKIKPESVISYVDLSISNGKTDGLFNNWKLHKINKPSATWVRAIEDTAYIEGKTEKPKPLFVKDSTARRISADRLLGFEVGDKYPRFDEHGTKITNDYVFLNEGYVKVYDAGTKTFIWNKTL